MKTKILFLDIDGVLTSTKYLTEAEAPPEGDETIAHRYLRLIDPEAVKRVKRILDETDARLVISSTVRKSIPLKTICTILRRKGLVHWVYSETPDLQKDRGHEIQSWIDRRKKNLDFGAFAILDDSDDMGHLLPKLVRTDCATGLLDVHVEKVIEMLNGGAA